MPISPESANPSQHYSISLGSHDTLSEGVGKENLSGGDIGKLSAEFDAWTGYIYVYGGGRTWKCFDYKEMTGDELDKEFEDVQLSDIDDIDEVEVTKVSVMTQTDNTDGFEIKCNRGNLLRKEETVQADIDAGRRPDVEGMFDAYKKEKDRLLQLEKKNALFAIILKQLNAGEISAIDAHYYEQCLQGLDTP